MKDFLFMIYACEEQKKEDFIEALAGTEDPRDTYTQIEIANSLGLDVDLLGWELEEMVKEAVRRWENRN